MGGPHHDVITVSDGINPPTKNTNFVEYHERETETACKNIDNRSASIGATRNQGSLGWCFGFTAADLMSQFLGVRVSSAEASVNYFRSEKYLKEHPGAESNSYGFLSGGQIADAISASLKRGVCKEDDIPYLNEENSEYKAYAKNLDKIYALFIDFKNAQTINNPQTQDIVCTNLPAINTLFPNFSNDELTKILLASGDSQQKVNTLYDNACNGHKIYPTKKFKIKTMTLGRYSSTAGIEQKTDELVTDQGHQFFPEIDRVLNKKGIIGISISARAFFGINHDEHSSHAMSIVGREYNAKRKRCEYIVRNSYGKNCSFYDRTRLNCDENGTLHVPEELLKKAVFGVTSLEEAQ